MTNFATDNFVTDYEALTGGCGCWELTQWSVITMTGQDRVSFLHQLCTADIRGLAVGAGCEAFCTDVKGKILAHVIVLVREEQVDLLTVPGHARPILEHFDRYIIREDVVCQDNTAGPAWTLVSGAQAPAALESLLEGAGSLPQQTWHSASYPVHGRELVLVRTGMVWPQSYLVRATVDELLEYGTGFHAVTAEAAWHALRLESGWPCGGTDFSTEHLPQELSRDRQAISFTKGCYLGQETIARIDALGHVNKRLCTLEFSGAQIPPPGTHLLAAGQQVGQVTSACWSPARQAPLALGMVRHGANELNTQLESACGVATVVAAATEQSTAP